MPRVTTPPWLIQAHFSVYFSWLVGEGGRWGGRGGGVSFVTGLAWSAIGWAGPARHISPFDWQVIILSHLALAEAQKTQVNLQPPPPPTLFRFLNRVETKSTIFLLFREFFVLCFFAKMRIYFLEAILILLNFRENIFVIRTLFLP